VVDLVLQYIVHLFNTSIAADRFPSCFKRSFITPIVKKVGLDKEDVKSYRLISNLSVLSKLLERLAARRLIEYIRDDWNDGSRLAGFRPLHSTKTAVLKVLSDLIEALDRGDVLSDLIVTPKGPFWVCYFSILYTADLIELIRSQNLQPHLYADDSGTDRPGHSQR